MTHPREKKHSGVSKRCGHDRNTRLGPLDLPHPPSTFITEEVLEGLAHGWVHPTVSHKGILETFPSRNVWLRLPGSLLHVEGSSHARTNFSFSCLARLHRYIGILACGWLVVIVRRTPRGKPQMLAGGGVMDSREVLLQLFWSSGILRVKASKSIPMQLIL